MRWKRNRHGGDGVDGPVLAVGLAGTGTPHAFALGVGVFQPCGRKHDFKDAERLVRRLMANELILSFVPNGEQRIWRSMTRMKLQLTRDRVRLQNQIECLLEEMRIKLSIVVSNLLRASGLRILHAPARKFQQINRCG